MKKIINFFIIFSLIFAPAFVLSACVGGAVATKFEVKPTTLSALNFYNNIRNQQNNFFDYMEGDISIKSGLENVEEVVYDSIKKSMQDFGNRIYLAMPALDFYLKDDLNDENQIGLYSLGDVGLDDFTLYKKGASVEPRQYYKGFSGSDIHEYLPITSRSSEEFKDEIDNTISTWGNAVNYDVSYKTQMNIYEIKVSTGFVFPSKIDLPARDQLDAGGLKIIRNEVEKKISVVYKLEENEDEKIYSKVITFAVEDAEDGGEILKKVEKYFGDVTVENDAPKLGEYEYEMSSNAKINGTYNIRFNNEKSYFNVRYNISTGNYWVFETYDFKDNLICRFNNVKQYEDILTYDFYLSSEGVSGRLKFFENDEDVKYIDNFENLDAMTFAKITSEDKNDSECRKMAFEILNGKYKVESFGY